MSTGVHSVQSMCSECTFVCMLVCGWFSLCDINNSITLLVYVFELCVCILYVRTVYTVCTVCAALCVLCVLCMYCMYHMYCVYCVYCMYCMYCMYRLYCVYCVYHITQCIVYTIHAVIFCTLDPYLCMHIIVCRCACQL